MNLKVSFRCKVLLQNELLQIQQIQGPFQCESLGLLATEWRHRISPGREPRESVNVVESPGGAAHRVS
jgi:hypothetical protein